jgi:hypothetical protein
LWGCGDVCGYGEGSRVVWMVDVKEIGIMEVARMIVMTTKVLLSALISETRSERGTGKGRELSKS